MKERRRSRGKEKLQMEKVNDYSLCSFFFFFFYDIDLPLVVKILMIIILEETIFFY